MAVEGDQDLAAGTLDAKRTHQAVIAGIASGERFDPLPIPTPAVAATGAPQGTVPNPLVYSVNKITGY